MAVVSRPSVRIGVIDLGIWMYAKGVAQNAPGGSSATGNGDDETAACLPSVMRRALIMGLALITLLILVGGVLGALSALVCFLE